MSIPSFFLLFIALILFSSKRELLKENLKEKILNKRRNIFGLIILFILAISTPIMSIPYWKDLPYVIRGNFAIVEGVISDEIYISGRDSHTLIKINSNTYTFYGSKYPSTGTLVSIKCLPNTKIIYTITEK